MNNAKTKLFQSGIIKCKAENANLRGFLGAELLDNLVCVYARVPVRIYARAQRASAQIVDIDTKIFPRRRLSARAKSCDIRLYCTLNVKLECRSAAVLCLEELHAIVDTLGKHLEYENTQKRLTFFFNLAIRNKKSPQNLLSVYLTNLHSGTPLQICYLNELKDGQMINRFSITQKMLFTKILLINVAV